MHAILGAAPPASGGFSLAPLATFVLAAALVAILVVGVIAIVKGGIGGKVKDASDRFVVVLIGSVIVAIGVGGLAVIGLIGTGFLKLGGIQ